MGSLHYFHVWAQPHDPRREEHRGELRLGMTRGHVHDKALTLALRHRFELFGDIYTQEKKMPTPLYGGEGVKQNLESKNGTQSNRDPCMTHLKCHTHDGDFLLDQMI
jgi:hypothetical protein